MSEDFDRKLSEKIKELIEKDLEPYNDKNWKKLKSKMYADKKDFSVLRFSRSIAAAILAVTLGGMLGVYIFNELSKTSTRMKDNQSSSISADADSSHSKNPNKNNLTLDDLTEHKSKVEQDLNRGAKQQIKVKDNTYISKEHRAGKKDKLSLSEQATNHDVFKDSLDYLKGTSPVRTNSEFSEKNMMAKNIDSMKSPENKFEQLDTKKTAVLKLPTDSVSIRNLYSLVEKHKKESEYNRVKIGLTFSSIINFEQADQVPRLGIGGGIFSEIPIIENVGVYTGILVANQKINFQNNQIQAAKSERQIKSREADLLGIDIPINLKYSFSVSKTNMFISAGFSSIAFFNEDFETIYQVNKTVATTTFDGLGNPIIVFDNVRSEESEVNSRGAFKNFYFAKILNFSFGIELPFIGSDQSIIIEPYFKHSLGTLTAEQIYVSSLGFNLAVKF